MPPRLLSTGFNTGDEGSYGRLVDAVGVHYVTAEGQRLIDASNTSCPLGHRHPAIVEAVRRSATAPVIIEGWHWPEREAAAQDLIDIAFAGEDWVGAVRFFLSASEANDAALSLAQALTGRTTVATRERAYHGFAGLSRDVTVQPHWHGGLSSRHGGIRPAPRMARVVELPAPEGAVYSRTGARGRAPADLLRGAPEALGDTAGVVIDYSQGGIYHQPAYQDALAGAARQAGALWIADETVTGFGRVGGWYGFQHADSRPDMVTMGKSLAGGGAPGGAVVLSAALAEQLRDESWRTYSTFRGHPTMVAALRAHLAISQREGLVDQARALEGMMRDGLEQIAGRHPGVERVDGRGLHWTIELQGPDWRDWRADVEAPPLASRVAGRAAEAGALIGTSGEETSLFIAPPLVIDERDLERILAALDHGLDVADRAAAEREDQPTAHASQE
jgi:4-aminobutyrate aminotransferase-like enzyme